MLYSGTAIAINGELLESTDKDPSLMHLLADRRSLDPAHLGAHAVPWWNELASWHGAGWLHLS
jgi:hypothetical protein